MLNVRENSQRLQTRFHTHEVSRVLPEYFHENYPNLVTFLEAYYDHAGENNTESFEHTIKDLFDIRDITGTHLEQLDLILGEISDGLDHNSFKQNPRLMVKLLSDFYRSKGTQISAEQFFNSFFLEKVEILYPKSNIFILNSSNIGAQSLKFLVDNRKYQIFSTLVKAGISFSDWESLYRKLVHPAGFYLAAEVTLVSTADLEVKAGETTDPLETPNYPIVIGAAANIDTKSSYSLLTMEETDASDIGIILSSLETLDKYALVSLQQIYDDFTTIGEWGSIKPPTLDDTVLDLSQTYESLDAG